MPEFNRDESGSLLTEYIQSQENTLQDGLIADFKASEDGFFAGDKVYIDRVLANRHRAKMTKKTGKTTYLTIEEILDVEAEVGKYSVAIPFNLDFGNGRRVAGKAPTDPINKTAFLVMLLTSRLQVLLNMAKRGMIWQASQIYQTGKIAFSQEDKALSDVDYNFSPELFAAIPNSEAWVTANGAVNQSANPLKNISDRMKLIYNKSGVSAFDVVMDGVAMNAFLSNDNVRKFADKNGINLSLVTPSEKDISGLAFYGSYFIDGRKVNLYLYSGTSKCADGELENFLDDGRVIIKPRTGGLYRVLFAGVETVSNLPQELKDIVPNGNLTVFGDNIAVDVWFTTEKKDENVWLKMVSRPLLAAVSVDTHGSFVVKATA